MGTNDDQDEEKKRALDELTGKNVAWYQTFISAWVESRMEKDKQVLTLSALGIGLLMALREELTSVIPVALWVGAGTCFLVAMIIILIIFGKNGNYLEQVLRDDDQEGMEKNESSLAGLTKGAFGLFILGAALTMGLVLSSINLGKSMEVKMADDKKPTQVIEGLGGAAKLKPAQLDKGLQGAGALKPSTGSGQSGGSNSGSSQSSGDKSSNGK